METLKLNTRLKTAEPTVALDPELPPGRYRLMLVVSNARGDSLPAEASLTVLGLTVVGPTVVSPTVLSPTVLSPTVLSPTVLSPTVPGLVPRGLEPEPPGSGKRKPRRPRPRFGK